jgi:hypothetical protein
MAPLGETVLPGGLVGVTAEAEERRMLASPSCNEMRIVVIIVKFLSRRGREGIAFVVVLRRLGSKLG